MGIFPTTLENPPEPIGVYRVLQGFDRVFVGFKSVRWGVASVTPKGV